MTFIATPSSVVADGRAVVTLTVIMSPEDIGPDALNAPDAETGGYSSVAAGDLDGDGKDDLVVATNGGNAFWAVLISKGDGTFEAPVEIPTSLIQTAVGGVDYPVGSAPAGLATSDFNGDGRNDVAVAKNRGSTLSVLLGGGCVP